VSYQKSIPLPEQLKHLPLDPRGYPIFFGALVGKDGTPFFTINDERKRGKMIERDLCSICGKKLFKFRWFAGGPRSAFDEAGAYIDMPMHDDCVHYALRVCPYLAAPRYLREIGQRQADAARAKSDHMITIDPTMIPERPEVFVAVLARGQKMVDSNVGYQQYVVPKRPYLAIEHWRHGQLLTNEEVARLPSGLQGRELLAKRRAI
jgi:hypothetical protein